MGELAGPSGVDHAYSTRMVGFVRVAPLLVAVAEAGLLLAITAAYTTGPTRPLIAVGLCLGYLPWHLYHLWCAGHARRPRGGLWTLAAMAVPILAGLPLVGYEWQPALASLLASAFIVLPLPWALAVGCCVVAGLVPADLALDPRPDPPWTIIVVLERTGAVLVPAWFATALHQLRAAREELAARAVRRERGRIDGELARTVGESLATIAARGMRAADLVGTDRDRAAAEVRVLVDGSRRTLAQARRMIRGYRPISLRAELDSAVALLSAAGLQARLVLPRGGLPDAPDGAAGRELTGELRAAVDRLLRDDAARACRITVSGPAGGLELAVAVDRAAPGEPS